MVTGAADTGRHCQTTCAWGGRTIGPGWTGCTGWAGVTCTGDKGELGDSKTGELLAQL